MSIVTDTWDLIKRIASIDETLQNTKVAIESTDDKLGRIVERFQSLERRVDRLEDAFNAAKPNIDEVAELRERVSKLETEQTAFLREVRAANAELVAERKGLAADAREIIAQIQTNPPQLPPTQPTEN